MISVDSESFLAVVVVAAVAAFAAGLIGPRLAVPVVVLEIVLGIVVGPELLGLAKPDEFLEFFSSLGLGMLFFFAGYEIDFERIRGSPLMLAGLADLARPGLLAGRPARAGRRCAVAVVYGVRARHHGHRNADSHSERRG
jgi:NhaP-type Na+/H+ and K+/H+ antiporter